MISAERLKELRRLDISGVATRNCPQGCDTVKPAEVRDAFEELEAARARIAELEQRIRGYESWERSVNEALNSGDGSYRP